MRFVCFNVNGLRAILNKDLDVSFSSLDADVFFLEETKLSEEPGLLPPFAPEGYESYWTISKIRKGYSGVAAFTRVPPKSVRYGLLDGKYDEEGRVITLEFEDFYFVGAYVPNAGDGLKRLGFRMQFEKDLIEYFHYLEQTKPIIYGGDLNVAHKPIDLKNPKANEQNPGYTIEERTAFGNLLEQGYVDTFRLLHPEEIKYSWWSYRFNARANNAGWRIDYFLVSQALASRVEKAEIHNDIFGSDHCPISLDLR
ncbi:MAG: exodeoxyribonuclease III [Bacilli bacterium]|nr:exodeoxyribonuclease III [Bacilli bacterium]